MSIKTAATQTLVTFGRAENILVYITYIFIVFSLPNKKRERDQSECNKNVVPKSQTS